MLSIDALLLDTIRADSATHRLDVTYEPLFLQLKPLYSLHKHSADHESSVWPQADKTAFAPRISPDEVFGTSIQKSGSIFRGLTLGSNRDLTLNSGFRMQLAGKLSEDLGLVAVLTDENVPIQPEGTTQTLQELDKVFIQLSHPWFNATLGDMVYEVNEKEGGEFGRLSRKLQGATGMMRLGEVFGSGSSMAVSATGATARGKYGSNRFQGIEGSQGPYRLSGEDPSRRPVVVAGTERVYLNGQPLKRGETNDYTIDYSTGEIYFSTRRLITNASRITVDFEYTDRQYVRNLVAVTSTMRAANNAFTLTTSFAQEADDGDSPVDLSLADSLKALIGQSGTDRFRASVSGVRLAGFDTATGSPGGQYILRDTMLSGRHHQLLVYAPGDPRAVYSATFTYLAMIPLDSLGYERSVQGGFVAAGLGRGNYLPVQLLPVPELRRLLSGRASYSPGSDISLSAEYAFSQVNANRFAAADKVTREGGAYKFDFRFHPKDLMFAGSRLGELDVRFSNRMVNRLFSPMDRFNEIEFERNWNVEAASGGDEQLREATMIYRPDRLLAFTAGYGSLERNSGVHSSRVSLGGDFTDSLSLNLSARTEALTSEDRILQNKSRWVRQSGTASAMVFGLQPDLRITMEDRREQGLSSDSLGRNSFRFLELVPRLALRSSRLIVASAEVQYRLEDSASHGSLERAFRSWTQLYEMQLREWNSLSGSISLALRDIEFSDLFAARGLPALNTKLVRTQTRYSPYQRAIDLEVLYEFALERSAALKRTFLRVPKGTGNYVYRGDVNRNGIAEEEEFEQTRFDGDYIVVLLADDQLVPVSEVKTGTRVRLNAARLFPAGNSPLSDLLRLFSSETVFRLEERSTEHESGAIALLQISRFLNDSTTLAGSRAFTQDVFINEADPSFSLRFRFSERRGLLRLVAAPERSYGRERSIRVRAQLLPEIGNQTEYINKRDRLLTLLSSNRRRDLSSDEFKTEFSYRPFSEWELAFGIAMSSVSDGLAGKRTQADLNDQFLRLTYSMSSMGQLRLELQREEAHVAGTQGNAPNLYPFELTNGRVIGKTYQWRMATDYRMSQYVQVSISYDGRVEGSRSPVHTARAEAKAFF